MHTLDQLVLGIALEKPMRWPAAAASSVRRALICSRLVRP